MTKLSLSNYADLIVQVTWEPSESAVLRKALPLMLPRIIFGKTAPSTSSEFGSTTKVEFSFISQLCFEYGKLFRLGGKRCIHERCEQCGVASGYQGS